MLNRVLPEEVGVRSADVCALINRLIKRNIHMHSLLLMRGNDVFLDCYWAPFHKDRTHRMYSVTKSFVSVAIGLAEEDGLIDLDARIGDCFPEKINAPLTGYLTEQTIRQMLTMTTVGGPPSWFPRQIADRTEFYLNHSANCRPAGTMWEYDSAASQVLSSLVEKVTGKRLFDYLNERIFQKIGAFQTAKVLSIANGDSWGDSAMICTPRDLATFARFVMNYGVWNGERLMNEQYLRAATAKQTHNALNAHGGTLRHGYGYQFWRTENNGFAFVGMGDQMAICLPDQDLIFVCTADNQGNPFARDYICSLLMDCIAEPISDCPLPANEADAERLARLTELLTLYAVTGEADSPIRASMDGACYLCHDNSLGWKDFCFRFDGADQGELCYTNARGQMVLPFGINKNCFGKFPELGYSREYGAQRTTDGHRYDDAVSAAWLQPDKLLMYVQIIDDYFGNCSLIFSFKDDMATVQATRTAEDFLWDYQGQIVAHRQSG